MSGVLNLAATTQLTRRPARNAPWRWHHDLYHTNEPIILLKLSAVRLLRSYSPWDGWFGIRIPACSKFSAHVQAPGLFTGGKVPRGGADQPRSKIGTAVPPSSSFCAGYRLPFTHNWSKKICDWHRAQPAACDRSRNVSVSRHTVWEAQTHGLLYTHPRVNHARCYCTDTDGNLRQSDDKDKL